MMPHRPRRHRQQRRRNTAPYHRPSRHSNHPERPQSRFTRRPSVDSISDEARPSHRRYRNATSPTSPVSDTAGIRQYQDRLHPAVIAAYRTLRSSAGRIENELASLMNIIEELAPGEDHMEWNFNPGTVVYMPAPRQPNQPFTTTPQEPNSNGFHTATTANNETQSFQQNSQQHGNTTQNDPTPTVPATAGQTFHPHIFATGPGYYPTGPPTTAEEPERHHRPEAWNVQFYPDPATAAATTSNNQQPSIAPGQIHADALRPANPDFNPTAVPNPNDRMTLPHLMNDSQTLPPLAAANPQSQSQSQMQTPQQSFPTITTTTFPYQQQQQQQPHPQTTNTITTPGATPYQQQQSQSQSRSTSTNPFPVIRGGPANSDVWRWRSTSRPDGHDDDDGEIM